MSTRRELFRAMTRTAAQASSGAAPVRLKLLGKVLGGLLLLSTP